jgi:hypothetical protein
MTEESYTGFIEHLRKLKRMKEKVIVIKNDIAVRDIIEDYRFHEMPEMWKKQRYDKVPSALLDALAELRSYIEIVHDELEMAINYFQEVVVVVPSVNREY